MSNVNVNIDEAAVTALHEFYSFKGYGVDFFIEAQSSNGTVYFQVVLYDDTARSYCRYIHEGDYVRVTGDLKVQVYKKKDGTAGCSLVIERPEVFTKLVGRNSESQLQQASSETENQIYEASYEPYAVSAPAETAMDYSDPFLTDEEIDIALANELKGLQPKYRDTATEEHKEDTTDINNSKKNITPYNNPLDNPLPF